MPAASDFRPARVHEELGDAFFDRVAAASFPRHLLRFRNDDWARRVGLDALNDEQWIAHFGKFGPLPGSLPEPLALRYHGHQFRSYNPDLGDGRGFLFAQMHDLVDGRVLDLGTKGSGQTPWSRFGDGRLTLKGGVREVLATEMLEALGVETSKTFSLIETGEELVRGDEPSPTRSAVLVRLSHSHIRIGSFQRLAFLEEKDNILRLLDHVIRHYMPELWREEPANRVTAFISEVSRRVARVGAQWMLAGFVHGVLNTDNINVTGESFDYGPWRFLPVLEPGFTAAYFDTHGLYAFGRQPDTLLWNLIRLAECFIDFAPKADLEAALGAYQPALRAEFAGSMLRRLGLAPTGPDEDGALAHLVWSFLEKSRMPFARFFFDWFGGAARAPRAEAGPAAEFYRSEDFQPLREALLARTPATDARLDHPYFAGEAPCTMLIEEVEAIWAPIADRDDWSVFNAKIDTIRQMGEAYGVRPIPQARSAV